MKNLKLRHALGYFILLTSCVLVAEVAASQPESASLHTATMQNGEKLVYADFETMTDRPSSSRGGWIQLNASQESPTNLCTYKGMAGVNPGAPDLVRLSKDSPNKAAAFDYQLRGPNQWGGVGIQINGQPDKDGKSVADDVAAYKYLALQVYTTGVSALKIELTSRGQGLVSNVYPQFIMKVSPGFNTYRIPLKELAQPEWADPKLSAKNVLKKLTSISITASCGPCTLISGTVVIDNLVFEN
jgi:hypothetical protein